nr:aldo/keto reductase [Yaniella sp.]
MANTKESLEGLGLDYLDLHLIRCPNPSVGKYDDTWRGLIELRERGLVRSTGVSNFTDSASQPLIASAPLVCICCFDKCQPDSDWGLTGKVNGVLRSPADQL